MPKLLLLTLITLLACMAATAQLQKNTQPTAVLPFYATDYYLLQNPTFDFYSDSSKHVHALTWRNIITGISFYSKTSKTEYSSNSPLEMTNFNTVEGFSVNLGLKIQNGDEKEGALGWKSYVRYGFSNERFNAKSAISWTKNKSRKVHYEVEGGRYVNQFNNENPIHSLVNSYYSLALRKNYLKLYGSNFGKLSLEQEIYPGIFFKTSLLYEDREPFANTSNFSFLRENPERNIVYTSNDPVEFAGAESPFERHQALILDLQLRILFQQQYISGLDFNIPLDSEYPNITLNYKRGLRALSSDVSFNFASINIGQNLDYGFFGKSSWDVNAGSFFNTRSLEFIDYKHFNGNQTRFINYQEPYGEERTPLDRFQLLDYYQHSTRGSYWTIHFLHNFNGFIADKIPLISNSDIHTIIGLNFLQTGDGIFHFELSTGLENIFRYFRTDLVVGYNNENRISGGIRLGFTIK